MKRFLLLTLCCCLHVQTAHAEKKDGFLRFERQEPHILEGAEQLSEGDYEGAEASFRKAATENKEHRAVVQYNLGSTFLEKAQSMAPPPPAPGAEPAAPSEEDTSAMEELFQSAQESFEDAYSLSSSPSIRSNAALAEGNTKVMRQDLEGAIDAYRKSLTADPRNAAARNNLLSALKLQQQQPPQEGGDGEKEPNEDQEENEDEDQKDEEKKDGEEESDGSKDGQEEKDQEQNGDDGDENQKDDSGENKPDDAESKEDQDGTDDKDDESKKKDKDGSEKDKSDNQEGKDGDKKPSEEKPGGGDTKDDKKSGEEKAQPPSGSGADVPEDPSLEEARRLLDSLRNGEKPTLPFQMQQHPKTIPLERQW